MAYLFSDSLIKTQVTISTIPGDKSISHRAIILGALAENNSEFSNFLFAEDCLNTVQIFKKLGVSIDCNVKNKRVYIKGKGLHGLNVSKQHLDVGNSGTGIRLITGVLAAQAFNSCITGDETILVRPMARIIDPLMSMGAQVSAQSYPNMQDKYPPLTIQGVDQLTGINYKMPIASAQVKSAILLAGLYANGSTTIIEPRPSRNHTEVMLKAYGAPITTADTSTTIKKTTALRNPFSTSLVIPSDFSSAAFFIVLGLLQKEAKLTLTNIGMNPTRNTLLKVLKLMGATIDIVNETSTLEPYADIVMHPSKLHNITIDESYIPFIIDEIPILAVAGMFAAGTMVVTGAKELRFKESDRIEKIVHLVTQFGGTITQKADGFILEGGIKKASPHILSGKDHRISMSAVIASLVSETPVFIDDVDCIKTSFPNFFDLIKLVAAP